MVRQKLYNYFFLILLLSCLFGLVELLSPFFGALVGAVFCGVIFYPLYERLGKWLPRKSAMLRALIAEGLVVVFFVIPLIFLTWGIVQESAELQPQMKEWGATLGQLRKGNVIAGVPLMGDVRSFSASTFGMKQVEFKADVAERVNQLLDKVSLFGTQAAKNTVVFALESLIMLFSLFFVFRDGLRFLLYVEDLIPMRKSDKDKLGATIQDTLIGVARGLFFTALAQGMMATVAYFIVGADGAIILGLLTAVIGLIPVIGTFGVWVPVGVYYFMQGSFLKGLFIFAWGALVVVAFCDAILRPYLVGKKGELHFFALFFALLGGVEVWGAKGMILGPLLVAVVPVMLEIYQCRYLRQFGAIEDDQKPHRDHVMEAITQGNVFPPPVSLLSGRIPEDDFE